MATKGRKRGGNVADHGCDDQGRLDPLAQLGQHPAEHGEHARSRGRASGGSHTWVMPRQRKRRAVQDRDRVRCRMVTMVSFTVLFGAPRQG